MSVFPQEDKEGGEDEHPQRENPEAQVEAQQVFLRQIHFSYIFAILVFL